MALLPLMVQAEIPVEREQQFTYYFYAAIQSIEMEQYDKALMQLLFCEQLNPEDGQTKDHLGLIYMALGDTVRARTYWEQAYQLSPDDLWEHYARALYASDNKKDQKQVIRILERAVKTHPKDEDPLDQLVNVYIANGLYKKALKAQQQLDEIKGYDAYSAITYYRIHVLNGQPKKALQAVNDYIEVEPRDLRFHLFRVQLYEQIGVSWDRMAAIYQAYLDEDPYSLMVLNNYAYGIATHGGDLKEAERMSLRTLQEEPNNPVYLDTYAWILHLQGQDSLAGFYIRKALEMASGNEIEEVKQHYQIIVK